MKALVWHGKSDVRCDNVPDPKIDGGVWGSVCESRQISSPGFIFIEVVC